MVGLQYPFTHTLAVSQGFLVSWRLPVVGEVEEQTYSHRRSGGGGVIAAVKARGDREGERERRGGGGGGGDREGEIGREREREKTDSFCAMR